MGKRIGKWKQKLMILLAAAYMFGSMPYTGMTVHAEEIAGTEAEYTDIMPEQPDTDRTDTEETDAAAENDGQKEDMEETGTEDSGQTGEIEDGEKEGSEDQDETDQTDETESGNEENTETGTDDQEGTEKEETDRIDESETGEEDEKETDAEETDLADLGQMDGAEVEEPEDEEMKEENSEESLMLLLDETEDEGSSGEEAVTDDTYTDENGVVYHYYGHEDGTANVYEITSYAGKDVNIPAYIGGYAVTQLTFHIWGKISSVTIPETTTYIGKIAFVDADIETLYYNAVAEVQVEPMPNAPFRHTKIGSLVTGEDVHIIPKDIFSFTEFQKDITITAEAVGENAFDFASFPSLHLTKQIREIQKGAFVGAKIQTLIYDTAAEHTAETSVDGMFRAASIQELVIDESVTELPAYVFCRANFGFHELTVNVERIGDHAFERVWESADKCCEELILSESVKYIGADAFAYDNITRLDLQADAESGASCKDDGCFYSAYIADLCIGEAVSAIPDHMFSTAHITMDELVLNVESIGKYAFYGYTNVTGLTIGEKVKEIGICAFADDIIANIHFNAVNAAVKGGVGETDYLNAPFRGVTIAGLFFGEQVTAIPDTLFAGADYIADGLIFPDSLTAIGRHAFHSSGIQIGELTIGENITSIGKGAFTDCGLNVLNYHAIEAELPGITEIDHYGNPFYLARIGELRIGNKVRTLPDYLFYCVRLTQEELTIPDSVVSIGTEVLSCSADSSGGGQISIGTLTIGENVSHIGAWAFGCGTYHKAVIYTNNSDSEVKTSFRYYLPICEQVEIHGNSPYYAYFTDRSEKENITLLCETFETAYGEEIYDEEKGAFVTTVTENCTVCGYEKTHEENKAACMVIFRDYDGRELSKQYVAAGSDADAPEISERTGYDFTGWDKSFQNVTSDIIVTAQYEAKTFSVVFKDGEDIISEQKIAYECDAKLPKDPERLEEAWGRWKFTGWNGNYQNVVQDEVLQAQFEKVFNKYEVSFYDAEGNVLSRQTVDHGGAAEEPKAPEKEATAQYSYLFTGWDGDTGNITGNADFYPTYETRTRTYTVIFVSGDTVVSEQEVAYGSNAELPEEPTRLAEEWGTWRFTGWQGNCENITQDEILYAEFEKTFYTYEIIFYDADDNILSRQTVSHGSDAKAPEAPGKEPTAQYSYTFTGWDGSTENITEDAELRPVYEARTRTYTVIFMNGSTVFDTQTVAYGAAAATPSDPSKEADEKYTYKFTGWDGNHSFITKDTTIYAIFEKEEIPGTGKPGTGDEEPKVSYTVIFADYDGSELSRQSIYAGEDAAPPEAPQRIGYQFTGWDKGFTDIASDLTITAQYQIKSYTVLFKDGDTVLSEQTVEYGSDAKAPEDPARPAEEWGTWKFAGWDGSYTKISQDTAIHAKFEKVFHKYEVIFYDAEGNVLSRQAVDHGSDARTPEAPGKEATEQYRYLFTGWDGSTENITGDSYLYPVYEARTRTYTVVFMNDDTVAKKQSVGYGNAATAPSDPVKEPDGKYTYRFAGWDKDHSFITGDMTVYALFEKEKITGKEGPEKEAGKEDDMKDKKTEEEAGDKDDTGEQKAGLVLDLLLPRPKQPALSFDLKRKEMQEAAAAESPAASEPVAGEDATLPETEGSGGMPDEDTAPEDIGDTEDAEKTDGAEKTEEAIAEETEETEETGDAEENALSLKWLFLMLLILIQAALSAWLFFFYCNRKKVCGTVLEADEEPVCGIRITLTGKDVLETFTDEDGCFYFDSLKKGSYRLDIFREEDQLLLSMDIFMKEKEAEDIFTVLTSNHSSLETKKERKKYVVDVTA